MRAIGLISGTSIDGIDAALIEIVLRGESYRVELLRFELVVFDADLLADIRSALPPNVPSLECATLLNRRLGVAFAEAAARVAEGTIDFVGSHGQTLWHDGARSLTVQIGDPYAIRDRIGSDGVLRFSHCRLRCRRSRCAAGALRRCVALWRSGRRPHGD